METNCWKEVQSPSPEKSLNNTHLVKKKKWKGKKDLEGVVSTLFVELLNGAHSLLQVALRRAVDSHCFKVCVSSSFQKEKKEKKIIFWAGGNRHRPRKVPGTISGTKLFD